MPEPFQTAFNV